MIDRKLRDRYSRQTVFPGIGDEGQAKLLKSRVVIIGCGALGCNIANLLARAGVGKIKIVDRDFPEIHNLQRQVLFDEDDIKAQLPKAVAAERRLKKVNSTIEIQSIVADVNYTNVEGFCTGADLIMDGLDNLETRLLINDVALKNNIPWVFGSAIGSSGMTMPVIPGKTPCFRCVFAMLPEAKTLPTCETAGVVGTVPAIIGALQATEALKILMGSDKVSRKLVWLDVWEGLFQQIAVESRRDCPACQGKYEYLERKFDVKTTVLCGQSRSVQVVDTAAKSINFKGLAARLKGLGKVVIDENSLHFNVDEHEIIVFQDGRAIVKNTVDEQQAKELYKKYVR